MLWLRNSWQKIHFNFIFVLPLLVLVFCSASVAVLSGTLYADADTWVDGSLPSLQVLQQSTTPTAAPSVCSPTTLTYFTYDTNPNSLGHLVSTAGCGTQNSLGTFINSNPNYSGDSYDFIKPETSIAFRVLHPGGRVIGITPVPNQASFMWVEPNSNYWGNPVAPHFYTNFGASGTFGSYGSPAELAYELNTTGATLTDSVGAKIYMKAYAFSQNGQWMVMEAYGLGLLRVNMQTLEMQLFSQDKFAYNFGLSASVTLAISDDGDSVIKSGFNASDTTAYDLSNCQSGVFTFNVDNSSAMAGCRSRDVQQSLQTQLSNFQFLQDMHYNADGKSISAVAISTGSNGVRLYNMVQYSIAGYQPPHLSYLALGDSFSSGEGAYSYVPGTNDSENKCHLSFLSYPYVTAHTLGIPDFHSVACAGATTLEYKKGQKNQNKVPTSPLGDWVPGYQGQGKYFNFAGKTSVVTISMIGNDIGFADKIKECLSPGGSCFHFQNDRRSIADEIYRTFDDKLYPLFRDIKTDSGNKENVKVYVMGYPQLIGDGSSCGLNTPFDPEERQMAHGFIAYLNAVIKAATIKAGVQYIDDEYAFAGHMLCDSGAKAVNGLSVDRGTITDLGSLKDVANSSFHPTPLGHQLMSQALLAQSNNFTKPMQAENPSQTAPYTESVEYRQFVNSAPVGGTFSHLVYVGGQVNKVVVRGSSLPISIPNLLLKTLSQFQVWFRSEPVLAGTLATDNNGKLNGSIQVPAGVEPGYHLVEIMGKDVGNQDIDMYSGVYVAASDTDFNGDGVLNSEDKCLIVPASGIDQDKDDIDDACDGEITEPPVDTTPPQVTGAADRLPDHTDWYNHDVSIAWASVDPNPSSGTPNQPDATIADTEGDHTYTSEQSCDPAGNCSTGHLDVKLDTIAPDITFTIDPAPNALGWNNSAAVVRFICSDATSGVENCTDPVTVSNEGGTIVTGTTTDYAGNVSSVNAVVAIDDTSPSIANTVSPSPNSQGWNNADVTVAPACADALSGVASCSALSILTGEGENQQVTSTAQDNAGNVASVIATINIDKTAPSITSLAWTGNPKAMTGPATLTIHAADSLAGVTYAEYFLGDVDPGVGHGAGMQVSGDDFVTTFGTDYPTGVYKVSVRTEDAAGNWSGISSDYLVVYNPFSIRMTGKKFLAPSVSNGDNLPGLISPGQTDLVKFGFSIGYDTSGSTLRNNDFQFVYNTGTDCNKPLKAENCHSFNLNASSITWFTTQGINNSVGISQGKAILIVDGATQPVEVVLTGIDGNLGALSADHLGLYIFKEGDNVSTATPLYQVNDNVARGNIRIKT